MGKKTLNLTFSEETFFSPREARPLLTPKRQSQVETPSAAPEVKPGAMPETPPALSGEALASIRDIYKSELRSRIDENKYYPAAARRLGQKGTVIVAFTLLADGSIIKTRIERSSGSERLDTAGLEAVQKVRKFKSIPAELGEETLNISVPIQFQ